MAEDSVPRPPSGEADPDRDAQPRPGADDAPRAADSPNADATAEHGPLDATAAPPPLDETQVAGPPAGDTGPSGTGILPAANNAPSPPRWSARARVPTRDLEDDVEWQQVDEPPRRTVFGPTLIIGCVLLLLGLIALGVWLGTRDNNAPGSPGPSASAATTTTATTTTATTPASPTSAPPTTEAAGLVPVPDVRGLSYEDAAAELGRQGFRPTRVDQPSADVPAGRVIGTQPAVGTQLLTPANIDVLVSTGPAEPPTSPAATTAVG